MDASNLNIKGPTTPPPPRLLRPGLLLLGISWLILLAASTIADRAVAEWVRAHVPIDKRVTVAMFIHRSQWFDHHRLFHFVGRIPMVEFLKFPGYFPFTLAVAAAVTILHRRKLLAGGLVALSGVLGGLLYCVIKWVAGRHRPVNGIEPFKFTPFPGELVGLFKSPPNLSFPSGHATLSFATAVALSLLMPRWTLLFLLGACIVSAERVGENAHYVSDVIAGAGLGTAAALVVWRFLFSGSANIKSRSPGPS